MITCADFKHKSWMSKNLCIIYNKAITMRILLFSLFVCSLTAAMGQNEDIVQWSGEFDKASQTINIKADIEGKWVIYSQFTDPEGPIPLEFEFEPADGVTLDGDVAELTEVIEEHSEMFGVTVRKFKSEASFAQVLNSGWKPGQVIKSHVTYMACNDELCLPPETVTFDVKL